MFPHSTPQQQGSQPNMPLLSDETRRFFEQTHTALLPHYWICTGCGTAHTRMLPEECRSCGATALEFEYALPRARPVRS